MSRSCGKIRRCGWRKRYEAGLPPVPLDESLCEQAFVNIVQNAYDAMGANGGTLRVQVSKSRASGRNGGSLEGVEISIEDTGPGIPRELREQIFNPFVTTKKTGVGLGLSIVSKIIDGHQGSIRIEDVGQFRRRLFCDIFPRCERKDSGGRDGSSGDFVRPRESRKRRECRQF